MTAQDITPDNSNRIAYGLSILFHPYLFAVPTLLAVLSDLNWYDIIVWTSIIIGVFVLPNIFLVLVMKREGKHTYQRGSRAPIYLLSFMTLFICLFLLAILEGPRILWVSISALIIWIPLQLFINQLFTKVSTHMAVVSGCGVALYMLNKLNHPLLLFAMVSIILLTAWARIQTKNHSLQQVILGMMSGGGTVILVFSALL